MSHFYQILFNILLGHHIASYPKNLKNQNTSKNVAKLQLSVKNADLAHFGNYFIKNKNKKISKQKIGRKT